MYTQSYTPPDSCVCLPMFYALASKAPEAMSTWGDLDAEQHLDVVCSASRSLLDILSRLNPVGDQGYVHRDIKPDNIMIDCRGNIRLSDFGIARALRGDEAQLFSPTCGSCPQFTPPEVLRYATLHKTSDLYSAGRVMIAMMLTDPSLSSLWDRRLELEQVPAQWPGYKRLVLHSSPHRSKTGNSTSSVTQKVLSNLISLAGRLVPYLPRSGHPFRHAFLRLVEALTHRDKHCRAYSDKLQDVSQLYQADKCQDLHHRMNTRCHFPYAWFFFCDCCYFCCCC